MNPLRLYIRKIIKESFENPTLQLPTVIINKVFHVGSLDLNKKSKFSLEGSGLSVSVNPDEWRSIAQLENEDLYTLVKRGGTFINAHKLKKVQKNDIVQWGVDNGYVLQEETFRVYYYDEELEQEVYSEFPTYEEAEQEADDVNDIKTNKGGIKPTEKLKSDTKQSTIDTSQTFDLLLTIYAEMNTNFDGVWWKDALDVSKYSAPRGVIFNSKLNEWTISKNN